jgi:DNA-binding response OmpR family regulator/two-component sensor histidine kinase
MTAPVLIVDDSLTVRMDLREAFEDAGLRPVEAPTAAAAREAFGTTAFGVVVLDVLLPDGDGISLLEEIRKSPLNARAPVMLLSTEAEVGDRVRGLSRGADEYVGKPYDAAYVVARVKELLGPGASGAREGDRRTVLVIDDSSTLRAELGAELVAAGYRVVGTETGEKGLRAAAEERPDAVILDGVLPGIDGHTVLRRMKLDANLRRTPVLMLTGSGGADEEVRALEAGADAFVRKDETTGAILARLGAMLRGLDRSRGGDLAGSSLGPKRILAVDDSAAFLEELSGSLRQEGYDVVLARSGEDALELLAVQRVDCVLLDLLMPGMSGHETCRRIRAAERSHDVPVIFLTAVEDGAALIQGIESGADDYVTKSSDLAVLRARVRAQLRRRQIEEENRHIRERLLRQEHEAAEARAARALAATREELLADVERKNRELREADKRKNEFLGVLSHELRNPLAPIRNAIEILKLAPEGSEAAGRAKAVIERQTTQLTRLVDDLLDVTRISRGKIQLRRSRVELTSLVRQVVEDHRPIFASRNIALSVLAQAEPQWVDADSTRIAQAIGNLLSNAAKFTDASGHVVVSVREEGPGETTIEVADDGIGIGPEMLGHLFEPFRQDDESLERRYGGLGLGLALVKGLVEMHEGRVVGKSPGRGAGATFTLTLPRLAAAGAGLAERAASPVDSKPLRLLIVEDNIDAAETLKEVLQMAGHEVAVAHDGADGVAQARSMKPDVVLCDIGLPGLDGYEVARRIRADPSISPTLIALTGYTRPEDERRTFKAGFDHHLGKPVPMAELEQVLASVTAQPRSRRILVVDDDDALRSNLREMLEDEGWEVCEAKNGKEAVEAVASFDPAVMLLDYRLPEMDGGEVLRRLGAIHAAQRVVLMTASSQVRQIAAQHGLRFYVPKPFRSDDLLDTLAHARSRS